MKLSRREEYERALLEGLWMTGDNYLHVQRWRSNFCAGLKTIASLPVWILFPMLPVEYYKETWIRKATDQIRQTIKIDTTTLATTRGKFACVCVEFDLCSPLRSHFRMHCKDWHIQDEGLQDLCFLRGKYGHCEIACPKKTAAASAQGAEAGASMDGSTSKLDAYSTEEVDARSLFGSWTFA